MFEGAGCLWDSAALDTAPKPSWKLEEAEMPSYDHVVPSPEDGLYRCEEQVCRNREGFSQKGQLKKHMRQHVKPVVCPRCPYSAAEQRDVRRHVQIAHSTLAKQLWEVKGPFPCALCDRTFTREDNLQRHHRRKHSAETRWVI